MDINNNTYAADKYENRQQFLFYQADTALLTEILAEIRDPQGGYTTDPNFVLPSGFENIS